MKTIKKSIICKQVNHFSVDKSMARSYVPQPGDVAIFEVVKLGSLNAIQDKDGRNCHIFAGDKIMATFGNRYASNQFEGYVPQEYQELYDLMGKGGVAGTVKSMYYKLELLGPTKLKLIGYAKDRSGKVINTKYQKTRRTIFNPSKTRKHKTVLSIGSSMDSGKTTSAAYLCRGLKMAGNKVAFIKLTGTVFNKDKMLAFDCGADFATDFADFGFPSTYLCSLECMLDLYQGLLDEVEKIKPDYVVMEIADGLFQRETSMLISNKSFMDTIDHVLFSSGDSLSAMQGISTLAELGIKPFALSGMINAHPLLVAEVNKNTDLPLLGLEELASADIVSTIEQSVYNNNPYLGIRKERTMLEVA